MKKFIGILLIFLILASALRDLITFAGFKANQDYIAENLCINRFDAIPMCQGKCFLQSEILEDYSTDLNGNPAPNLQNRVELIYVVNDYVDYAVPAPFDPPTPALTQESFFVSNNYTSGVFRPPIFLV